MDATMKAVRVHDWGVAPVVEDVPVPVRAEGTTLVRVEAAAVGHLDRTVAGGNFGMKPALPYVGGVEGCGRVVASDELPEGTRVMLRGGGLGLVRDGTWAELVTAPTANLLVLPEGMSAGRRCHLLRAAHHGRHRAGRGRPAGASGRDGRRLRRGRGGGGGRCGRCGRLDGRPARAPRGCPGARAGRSTRSRPTALPSGVEPLLAGDDAAARGPGGGASGHACSSTPWAASSSPTGSLGPAGGRAVSIGYVAGEAATLDLPNWLLLDVPCCR